MRKQYNIRHCRPRRLVGSLARSRFFHFTFIHHLGGSRLEIGLRTIIPGDKYQARSGVKFGEMASSDEIRERQDGLCVDKIRECLKCAD
ncbi:hypothetical protein BDA96_08G076400 [Sorghum bicolor]|uniref:Uncharacterized protein n=2 Tax=Sorghum bicolor TaxID=4558 RepID=A0A1B6PBZ5_SORBI|nr:hypothetical protein BDA96_08G076400 [Sorghum bicolor]KXG23232.1 hypothetical protein SORBI_3008G071700 [Sorghum bicolor]